MRFSASISLSILPAQIRSSQVSTPILQFGTSRFLQAHVDLFVSDALKRGQAIGAITVVQTTRSSESTARVAALAAGQGYPVHIRGLRGGVRVDQVVRVRSVQGALRAEVDWLRVREIAADHARVIVSNTGDRGFDLDETDGPGLIDAPDRAPRSFVAKMLVLLYARWREGNRATLSIFPCELVSRNGDVLRAAVRSMAVQWSLGEDFVDWLGSHCVWANSLVDRIVSEALHPVGAVAEPYALWAIERQPGLVLPCSHEGIVLTDDLERHERLKLFLLNAGHTFLAERWLTDRRADGETVQQAMNDAGLRRELESFWADEVLPVFEALGQRADAEAYLVEVRERLLNPFLAHRLADIAQDHAQKKQRRLLPIADLADRLHCAIAQPRLRAALVSSA
jgi:tagaturonate reductase